METGTKITCHKMPSDSFYKAISGEVLEVKGAWAKVRATRVIDKWSTNWEDHPTSCVTHVRAVDLVAA